MPAVVYLGMPENACHDNALILEMGAGMTSTVMQAACGRFGCTPSQLVKLHQLAWPTDDKLDTIGVRQIPIWSRRPCRGRATESVKAGWTS